MKTVKQFFAAITMLLGVFGSQAAHAGIPVIDTANLAEAVQQVIAWGEQYQQMAQQIEQYAQQIQQMQAQLQALTGSRNLGNILNNPALQGIVPANVLDTYNQVSSTGFAGLNQAAQAIRAAQQIYDCAERLGQGKLGCEASLAMNAQTLANFQSALATVTQRVQQIQGLQDAINATNDPKAIAELQARIQAENAQVSNDANRLAVMKALSDAQREAVAQAARERTLKQLAPSTPAAVDSFEYRTPQ